MNARLPLCMAQALAPFAPASSVVHKIVSEDRALQADLDYLNKLNSGEFDRRRWDAAQRQQMELQGVTGRTM
ncbi:MAG: hypothetical protein WAW73_20190 [Rhodoferax sp.]